jgi:alpha-beta hydrolase superfamily lysophospholipase
MMPWYARSYGLKLRMIAIEYPQFGFLKKPEWGSCSSESSVLQAARATVQWLLEDQGVPLNRLILMGFSIGSGSAVDLAYSLQTYSATEKPAALILLAPFTSIRDVVKDVLGWWKMFAYMLFFDRFRNKKWISKIDTPTLYIHGKNDTIVRPEHSRKLFKMQKTQEKRRIVMDGGHNNIFTYQTMQNVIQFMVDLKRRN